MGDVGLMSAGAAGGMAGVGQSDLPHVELGPVGGDRLRVALQPDSEGRMMVGLAIGLGLVLAVMVPLGLSAVVAGFRTGSLVLGLIGVLLAGVPAGLVVWTMVRHARYGRLPVVVWVDEGGTLHVLDRRRLGRLVQVWTVRDLLHLEVRPCGERRVAGGGKRVCMELRLLAVTADWYAVRLVTADETLPDRLERKLRESLVGGR
jgi:hypothetical protein